jgi:hypothetical protein
VIATVGIKGKLLLENTHIYSSKLFCNAILIASGKRFSANGKNYWF